MSGRRAVAVAERAYAWLLRGLPTSLVSQHGREARADFSRVVRAANESAGGTGVIRALVPAVLDVVRRIPVEHWHAHRERRAAGTNGSSGRNGLRRGEKVKDIVSELWRAARSLLRRPGYAGAAILTLGLGIGANVAIFTIVNSVLLRPLAYPDSDRIVQIRHHAPGLGLPELNNSPGLIQLYRDEARSLQSLTATNAHDVNLTGGDRPARVRKVSVDVEFFDVFATRPVIGRAFNADDVARDASPVAILMHDAWRSRFGGDPAVLGSRIELDGESTEVIGVMPEGFAYPDPSTVALVPAWLNVDEGFGAFGIRGLARLAEGSTLESATAEFAVLQGRIPDVWPDLEQTFLDQAGWAVSVNRLRDLTVKDIERALWVLFGTVGLVLLIAGANVANLFLVRAESRQREVAIRSALGATRRRLASTFISESVLLGLGGGVVGSVLAWGGVRLLVASGPAGLPRLHEIGVDGAALAFGAALSVLAGLALGLMPMFGRQRDEMAMTLREGGRTATAGKRRYRTRNLLIAGQVAMAVVLLASSGLMLRSVLRLSAVDPGLDPNGVLTVGVAWGNDRDREATTQFYDRVLEALAAIPGVEAVGAINALPLDPISLNGGSFDIESAPRPDDEIPPTAMYSAVTPGFFETVGIDIIDGRYPERGDHLGGPPVVWISEQFARDHFIDGAIGERIRFGSDTIWADIAGVVSDVRTFGLREEMLLMAYYPLTTTASADRSLMHFAVRARGDAAALLPSIRDAVARVDPNVPLTSARTMDDVVASSMAEMSFTVVLLAIAAAVALLLGAIGLYGVVSWVVAQRTHEMGVRIALGARPADVRTMVVRQGMIVTIAGIIVGLVVALGATRLLASLLYEVSAYDPLTFTIVPIVLFAVSLLAAWLPARRAAAVDPLTAMRVEG
jgi:predicted permease